MNHNHDSSRASPKFWLFVLLCLTPIAALAAVFVFGLSVSSTFLLLFILACPLSHFFLMGHGGHNYTESTLTTTDITGGGSVHVNK